MSGKKDMEKLVYLHSVNEQDFFFVISVHSVLDF